MTVVSLAASAGAGAALGVLHLALLWAGARALAGPRPGRAFLAWALARAALVLGTLAGWVALGAPADALAGGLAGFLALRLAATRLALGRQEGAGWR
jgi:hypothetical protein